MARQRNPENDVACHVCGKMVAAGAGMNRHMKQQHPGATTSTALKTQVSFEDLKCGVCSAKITPETMDSHFNTFHKNIKQ